MHRGCHYDDFSLSFSLSFVVNKCIDFISFRNVELTNIFYVGLFCIFFCFQIEILKHSSEMKTANWISFAFYGILLLVFAIISSGQTAPQNRIEKLNDTASADIFGTPRIAKRKCTMGKRWADGKCRQFVD